jgi:Family of unknown function (DUF5317)
MLRLTIIVIVIVAALMRGGSLRHFAALRLRWLPLVIIGFVLQLLIFTPFASAPVIAFATLPIYVLSLALVTIWVAANWRVPGMTLIAIGLALNVVVIAANGGHMPVSPEAARLAGKYEMLVSDDPAISKHIAAVDGQVRLWLLSDLIAVPKGVPFAAVLSIGDIVLTVGIGILCYSTICRPPAAAWPAVAFAKPADGANKAS